MTPNEATKQLFDAIQRDQLDRVREALDAGADLKAKQNAWTPLHWAAARGNSIDIVKLLIERGASLKAVDDNGRTPQDLAEGNRQFYDLLRETANTRAYQLAQKRGEFSNKGHGR